MATAKNNRPTTRNQTVSAQPAKRNTQQPKRKTTSPTTKPKMKTMYASGVIIDGQTWTENKDGTLVGTCKNLRDAHLLVSKSAATLNSERIAKRFSRTKKAKPFISAIRIEV